MAGCRANGIQADRLRAPNQRLRRCTPGEGQESWRRLVRVFTILSSRMNLPEERVRDPASQPEPDDGLRRLLTWTFVALVVVLLFSAVAIYLVTRWFA